MAAGRIDGGSTDAINGSQLFATNQAIGTVGASVTNLGNTVTNLGNAIANSYGGTTTYDPATGTINTSITYGGNTFSSLQQVFNQIDTGGIKYFHANSNLADSLANGLNSVAIGPGVDRQHGERGIDRQRRYRRHQCGRRGARCR